MGMKLNPMKWIFCGVSISAAAFAHAEVVADYGGVTLFREDKTMTFAAGRHAGRKIMLPPDCAEISVAVRMRTDGVVCGNESWKTARTTMSFRDADGKMVGGWPDCFSFEGTRGWMDLRRTYDVPRGAVRLDFGYGNHGSRGTAEFSAVSVAVARFRAKKPGDAPLPSGAPKDPWSLGDAWKSTTATRVRWCLNGLWGLRPPLDGDASGVVPKAGDNWGWGKIPSVWEHPGGRKKEGQEVYLSGWLLDRGVKKAIKDRCWYRREFVMPPEAAGRKVALTFTMLNTRAEVYVDGKLAGDVSFPGGQADITAFARPGEKQEIALYVTAFPLDEETLSFNAPDRADRQRAEVQYKGVTGDVYLDISPRGECIASATVACDVATGRARFMAEIADARPGATYALKATVAPFRSVPNGKRHEFAAAALAPDANGTLAFDAEWKDAALWDVHTPGNRYACRFELSGADGQTLDVSLPFAFGFRDVKIAGRDLLLNGTPIHLRGQVSRNMKASPGVVCRESVREMCRRMKADGVNFLIADNYNFSPGGVSYFDAWLDVCDEEGMLVSFSLPHARDFRMKLDDPATARRYRDLAKWIVNRVRNHPCVIMYAMNHNAGGYTGDMNPLRIDGKYDLEPEPGVDRVKWALRNRDRIRVARRIARELDPTRPAYHHESGNLDDFHTTNIYLNWAPVQERSDWLEHWNREGVKPLFFVEWGMPHIASWSSYRGPQFIHSHPVWQSIWASEFAAALRGDAAYLRREREEALAADWRRRADGLCAALRNRENSREKRR